MNDVAEGAMNVANETVNQMQNFFHVNEIVNYVKEPAHIIKFATGLISLLIFWGIYRLIRAFVTRGVSKRLESSAVKTVSKFLSYSFYILIVLYVLGLFGINLSAIWGAMGIAGVAIGFAAQTTVSNLISGVFILTEKTMKIGDFIEVDGISGTVDKVSLLSIWIHTPDNQFIRIPSSAIINTKLKNYSTYDYRRYVFDVSVDYSTDLDKAVEVLKSVPEKCEFVIKNNPDYDSKVLLTDCRDSGIGMNLIVWCERPNFFDLKTEVCRNVVKAFNENGINIPFNRVDVSVLTDKTVPSLSFKA
ncbi:mechanosensitive ion channel family protein [Treponema ruminis]|uniref:Small-conductance mechanosensitive channel n=1 Tax=Treponema ruminis TaxID=744515 RepID=A0A7W8GBH7_9SPIR|nr:mechanosensitive ion channel family protein [Treponema ruminis]MBB5227385.1 small-conductance mechanosensitive channel [Treponema ruminis]QSI01101.1 mechanosensitive ion channel family protein [Treponema ruminis]